MMKNKDVVVKKTYVSPEIESFNFATCGILMASGGVEKKYRFCCPYIPETPCSLYDEFMRKKFGINRVLGHEKFIQKNLSCPYRNSCEEYELYRKITSERQR